MAGITTLDVVSKPDVVTTRLARLAVVGRLVEVLTPRMLVLVVPGRTVLVAALSRLSTADVTDDRMDCVVVPTLGTTVLDNATAEVLIPGVVRVGVTRDVASRVVVVEISGSAVLTLA